MCEEKKEPKKSDYSDGCVVIFFTIVPWPATLILWAFSGIDELFVFVLYPLMVLAYYLWKGCKGYLKNGSKVRAAATGLALIAVVLVMPYCYYRATTSYFRQNLPWGVEEFQEKSVDCFPDHSYFLKVRISAEVFAEFVARVELTRHSDDRNYTDDKTWLSWNGLQTPAFWDASDSLEGTYVRQSGDCWTFAKYENGYLYLRSLSH